MKSFKTHVITFICQETKNNNYLAHHLYELVQIIMTGHFLT